MLSPKDESNYSDVEEMSYCYKTEDVSQSLQKLDTESRPKPIQSSSAHNIFYYDSF
jgi:hypothetical protein